MVDGDLLREARGRKYDLGFTGLFTLVSRTVVCMLMSSVEELLLQATGSFWLGGLSLTLCEIVTWTACNATSLVSKSKFVRAQTILFGPNLNKWIWWLYKQCDKSQ